MGSAALLQFWCIVLHPTIDRCMIDVQAPLEHHLFQISVAERIPEVPADTEQNDLGLEVAPFERGGVHEIGSSQFSEYRRVYCILAIFATQPVYFSFFERSSSILTLYKQTAFRYSRDA